MMPCILILPWFFTQQITILVSQYLFRFTHFLFFFLRFCLFIFREKGRKGEGEKNTRPGQDWAAAQACALPDWESNQRPFALQDNT